MPQLDVSTYCTQIFWALFMFTSLFIIAKTFIVPRMDGILANRLRHINSLLEQASKLVKEAKDIEQEVEARLENERMNITLREEKTVLEMNKNIEKKLEDLKRQNAERNSEAIDQMDRAMKDLLADLEQQIPQMVEQAYNRIYSKEDK